MKLIGYEIRKLTGSRLLWGLIFLLFLSAGLLVLRQNGTASEGLDCRVQVMEYPAAVQTMIEAGEENLAEYAAMGMAEDAYAWRAQEKMKVTYENARDHVRFTETTVRGWHLYFAGRGSQGFLFLAILLLGGETYIREHTDGFLPVLRVSGRGRRDTVWAKSTAMAMLCAGLTLAFTLEAWLLCGLGQGYSDPGNGIQILEAYTACPWVLTMGETFLLTLGLRMLAAWVFGFACTLLSVVFYRRIPLFLGGLGFLGLNYFLYGMRVYTPDSLPKHLNLLSAAVGQPLLERYRSVNLLGWPVGFVPLLVGVYVLLLAVFCTVTGCLFARTRQKPRFVRRESVWRGLTTAWRERFVSLAERRQRRRKTFSLSLYGAERYKTLAVFRVGIVLLVLFCVKIPVAQREYRPDFSFTDTVYHGYMTALAGKNSEEKEAYIRKERAYIEDVLAHSGEMEEGYRRLTVSREAYMAYRQTYEYAASRQMLFGRIEDQAAWIGEMAAADREAWYVYDTGWRKIFGKGFDWTLYGALLALAAIPFPGEWDGGTSAGDFARILRTTRYGRGRTFAGKWLGVGGLSVAAAGLWYGVDLWFLFRSYDMPLPDAPLCSLTDFAVLGERWTLFRFALFLTGYRILAAAAFALLTMLLSARIRKMIPSMALVTFLTMTPKLLGILGFDRLQSLDFTRFWQGTPVILAGYGTEWLAAAGAIVVALTVVEAVRWCGRK